jgi:hypothetical protein
MMRNVLLVAHEVDDEHEIVREVASQLTRLGVRARTVHDVPPALKHRLWTLGLPTSVFSLREPRRFRPTWASIWEPRTFGKAHECRVLEAAGIAVPRWTTTKEGEDLDLSGFSSLVVTKPDVGLRGAMVRMMRRNRVRHRTHRIAYSQEDSGTLIVQEYIHTGPWPTSFRVGTIFGEPLYTLRIEADRSRDPIPLDYRSQADAFTGKTIVASSKGCRMSPDVPQDILELGCKVHRAFPDMPLLATDILRDHETGQLYVIEVNTGCGLLPPATRERLKGDFGVDIRAQFGGCANALARGIYARVTDPRWRAPLRDLA